MTEEYHLRTWLVGLGLPEGALSYLCDLYNAIQVFDDVEDKDPVAPDDLQRAIWWTLVGCNSNPFYAQNSAVITPVVAAMVLKWRASNKAEAEGRADQQSYMHRAGFYDVVLMVCHLCGLSDDPDKVLRLYGETYDQYIEEFR